MTLGQQCHGLTIARQAVAKHIGVLRAADLVVVRRDGRYRRHYLNPVPLADIVHRWIGRFEDVRIEAMIDLRDRYGSPESENKEKRNG